MKSRYFNCTLLKELTCLQQKKIFEKAASESEIEPGHMVACVCWDEVLILLPCAEPFICSLIKIHYGTRWTQILDKKKSTVNILSDFMSFLKERSRSFNDILCTSIRRSRLMWLPSCKKSSSIFPLSMSLWILLIIFNTFFLNKYFISDIFKYTPKAWDSYTIAKSMFFNCVQVMNESVSTQISLPKKALQGSLVFRWI